MISGSALLNSTSWDVDSIILAGDGVRETGRILFYFLMRDSVQVIRVCVCVCVLTSEHKVEEVACSSKHHSVSWEVFPLNHQGYVTQGALHTQYVFTWNKTNVTKCYSLDTNMFLADVQAVPP